MYRHLLVPIDDTDLSIETVSRAVEFARTLDARITFFHAQPDHAASLFCTAEAPGCIAPAEFTYVYENRTRELLAKAESAARAQGVPCDSGSSVNDSPYQAILAAARDAGCDLIFVASHCKSGSIGTMLGSQTLKVLMHSDIPVLVSAPSKSSLSAQAIAIIRDEHRSLAAVLHAWLYLIQTAEEHGHAPDNELMQSIMRYIQTFPATLHHPKENEYLFRKLRERTSEVNAELDELERQHQRDTQLIMELAVIVDKYAAGESSLDSLKNAVDQYAKFMWEHLGREEGVIIPAAQRHLTEADWNEIKNAFCGNHDPRFSGNTETEFKHLFSRIVNLTAPIAS
ncbi:universal stress protein [Crenobacter sp. SG2305]|uniref:universal stress protein n=1 Tax=Crenobacter oryzisoli TaxID=3056844 RepID=UPI0025AA725B|nr:universal stress protein [Crenobacter sp. SG2305]MDN0083798.1 universal stress protein [Crenobacter sp. SG2305]